MEKLISWLVILLGILLILPTLTVSLPDWVISWVVPLIILAIGVVKLIASYKK